MNIRSFISEIFKEDMLSEFREGFDMVHFASLKSFKSRMDYAERELQKIGAGTSRVAYKIDETKVLKLAKNKKGLSQNETEADQFLQEHYIDIIPKIFDQEENYLWIVSEKADNINVAEFKKLSGLDFYHEFYEYMNYAHRRNDIDYKSMFDKENDEKVKKILLNHPELENSGFVRELIEMILSYDLIWGDFQRIGSYGVVHRNGRDVLVVRDFGLTKRGYKELYN